MQGDVLIAVFVFLAAAIAVVPIAKATGLGSVLGYLIAGILIGPYALQLVSDPETILHFAELGVVMMLFLIGLELQPRELWSMRNRLIGLGMTQVLVTAALLAGVGIAMGLIWQSAVVAGLALALSSTAIVLQLMNERRMMRTRTGRAGFSVLLFQDIAVIPILAIIPLLHVAGLGGGGEAAGHGAEGITGAEPEWQLAARIVFVFALMFVAGRYLLRPLMRFVARTGIREIFTALALFLVVGAVLLMQWIGISPALGAFTVGMILADSEYRHELESDIEPFKGLLLGLFFISVGTSIEFSILMDNPLEVSGLVVGLIALKFVVLFALAFTAKLVPADRLLFAILLAQGGEFAFVLLQFGLVEGAIAAPVVDILIVSVALSMTVTPLLILAFDRLIAPRMVAPTELPDIPDMGDTKRSIIILGYGRFGQIVGRLLQAQGFQTTLIDHDPAQIELVRRFDFKVFYGDGNRLDLLHAAKAGEAALIVVALGDPEKVTEVCALCRRHFPDTPLVARATSRNHAFQLMDLGVINFERESFRSGIQLGVKALIALGFSKHAAQRLGKAFEKHDIELLQESYALRHDEEAFVAHARNSRETLRAVMNADRMHTDERGVADWQAEADHIDKESRARSD